MSIMELAKRDVGPSPAKPRTSLVWFLLRVSKVLGCFPARNVFWNRCKPPEMRWRSWEIIWSLLAATLTILSMLEHRPTYTPAELDILGNTVTDRFVGHMSTVICIANVATIFVNILVHCPNLCDLICRMEKLDVGFQAIGIELPRAKLEVTLSMAALIGLMLLRVAVSVLYLAMIHGPGLAVMCCAMLELIVQYLPSILIYSLVQALGTRLEIITTCLEPDVGADYSSNEAQEEKVDFLCRAYQELCKMIRSVSNVFGCYLVVLYALFVFMLVVFSYWTIQVFGSDSHHAHWDMRLITLFTCLLHVLQIVIFTVGLSNITRLAHGVRNQLAKTKKLSGYQQVDHALHEMSDDSTVEVTAADFFSINRRLLTSITGAVTTYLVVAMQFRIGEE